LLPLLGTEKGWVTGTLYRGEGRGNREKPLSTCYSLILAAGFTEMLLLSY
jgi:hypothetical protein